MIAGIISTLAVLGFRKAINHQKLLGETGKLLSKMRYIASESRVSKRNIAVYSSFVDNYMIAWHDEDMDGVLDDTETVIDSMRMGSGLKLIGGKVGNSLKTNKMLFHFNSNGAPQLDTRLIIYSTETKEFKGIYVRQSSGWVEEYEPPKTETQAFATSFSS